MVDHNNTSMEEIMTSASADFVYMMKVLMKFIQEREEYFR